MDPALQPPGLEGMPAAGAGKPTPTIDARHPAEPPPPLTALLVVLAPG